MRVGVLALAFAMLAIGPEAGAQRRRRRPAPPNAAVVALQRSGTPATLPAMDYRRLMLRQVGQPRRSPELLRAEVFLLRCALAGPSACRGPLPF
jgi:hypothetical protein